MATVFDTINIRGKKIQVTVTDEGLFRAHVDGENVESTTFKALKDRLSGLLSRNDYDIPFIEINDDYGTEKLTLKRGKIVSVHSGNGNAIVVYDDNKNNRVQKQSYNHFLSGNTNVNKLKQMHKAKMDAANAYDAFLKEHELDWRKEIADAGPQSEET